MRKFNKWGIPLPNKKDYRLLNFVDKILKKRLVSYIITELQEDTIKLPREYDTHDTHELAKLIFDDIGEFSIKDKYGSPIYYIFLKNSAEYFLKNARYDYLKEGCEGGSWSLGWMPDLYKYLEDFEESYALVLLWLNEELKKFGTSIPQIESSIKETRLYNTIKKIIKEQIVKEDHNICGTLTCDKLENVIHKIDHNRLHPKQKYELTNIFKNYQRDIKNNLKDVPKSGGLKGATGDSGKDISNMYLHEIQSLICKPTQK